MLQPRLRSSLFVLSPLSRRLPASLFFRAPHLLRPTRRASTIVADDVPLTPPSEAARKSSSFYISNVFPVRLASWDPRPSIATVREESIMERLHDIAAGISGNGFRIESWEIERKDGGVFLHFSYVPPESNKDGSTRADKEPEPGMGMDLSGINALPEASLPAANLTSPGQLFLPQLVESAKKHGGFPSWLGQWWADWLVGQGSKSGVPGHAVYSSRVTRVGTGEDGEEDGTVVRGSGSGIRGLQAVAGGGRVWLVKGRQWTEDMSRYPSPRLRVEFEGPDVSQEMLYTLFRPYGRVADITPPAPVPAGSLRFATVSFSRITSAATAINCLHGYSTPTNTADYTLRTSGSSSTSTIPLSRLRLYYDRPLKAHAIRDWISAHPRIALPLIAFLVGTLSYTFFDPIRAFFVKSKVEGVWDIEKYSIIKSFRSRFKLPTSFNPFHHASPADTDSAPDAVGKDAWKDRIDAEKSVERWLSEYPSTFITITGPPGSGKASLVSRVLKKEEKPSLVIDCAAIAKAKNDGALISALADETGYWPVFSFLSSLNGLIDLASVGLIGQKAGFSTPVDQQLRGMLEVVGSALRDSSTNARQHHKREIERADTNARLHEDMEARRQLIRRGGWHDGRLDCIAGNGAMSELGLGEEPTFEGDLLPAPPLIDDNAPIDGEAVPPTAASLPPIVPAKPVKKTDSEVDEESEFIKTLPIVVLQNFAQKTAKGDLWNVMAEWGASLVENRIAHVIVVTEGATATKALNRALPSKPLNTVALSDADEINSLNYVQEKLGSGQERALTLDEGQQIAKLGGRMVDLETLVYKVRTGSTVQAAVDDIVLRNVVELRKQAFGDDAEDAKALPWSRAQAWKVVSELAAHGEISYSKLLQEFPFKGSEQSLKALEEHELVSVTYVDGRASRVKPGKPVFRYAFEAMVKDPVFRAFNQIEYNSAIIASADSSIKSCETELSTLKEITANGGDDALGVTGSSWLGLGKHSAIKDRARWLMDKMGKNVDKLSKLEGENEEMMKVLSSGRG